MKKNNYLNYNFKNPLVSKVFTVAKKVNIKVYIVGGAVRDIFLNTDSFNDIDFIYSGKIEKLLKELNKKISYKKVEFERDNLQIKRLCFNNFILDFQNIFKNNLKKDLSRRDFTINSIALEKIGKDKFKIIDYFNGQKDLKDKKIQPVSKKSFKTDPLRILRLFRFAQNLNLRYSQKTLKQVKEQLPALSKISEERIKEELIKIFSNFENSIFKDMSKLNIFKHLFGEKSNISYSPIDFVQKNYLNNLIRIFDINKKVFRLPDILSKLTFSKKDVKKVTVIHKMLEDQNNEIPQDDFIKKYMNLNETFLYNSQKYFSFYYNSSIIEKWLNKILKNYRFILDGNWVMKKFNVTGENLGKLINQLHFLQIKYNIRKKENLMEKYYHLN
ncbi:MAG TPA: hypothetical protein VKN74_03345 [Candidatus Mcinerneyibacterium sp.]|nr:hypothetical protein [Candidatus Mcinerneyibacterium sp.]